MRREVRNLYKALLRERYGIANLNEFIDAHNEYNDYRESVCSSPVKRKVIKIYLPTIKKAQYIKWAEQYLLTKRIRINDR